MPERLWIIGAFVTTLLSSALLTVLVFHYLRTRSRLAITFVVFVSGAMCHLLGEIGRLSPVVRLMADGRGFVLLTALGVLLTTYGLAVIVVPLTVRNRISGLHLTLLATAAGAAVLFLIGEFLRRPALVRGSLLVESSVGLTAAVLVLAMQHRIPTDHVRRLALVVAGTCAMLIPVSIVRLILGLAGSSEAAGTAPPWNQLVIVFVVISAVLVFSGRWLIGILRIQNELLDPRAVRLYKLSPRESEIIVEISRGRSNDEIGNTLFISTSTVKNHIYHIYRKIGIHNRVELLNTVLKKVED